MDLFFCLSGFIFFWLYSERLATRQTSFREFAVLRISRLYPLHFLTLLIVLAGQQFMHWRYGSHFVYPHNDCYHFVLQLFMASDWGFERGYSFNGPIWSVSVEMLLYLVFFLICLLQFRQWWQLVFLAFGGYLLLSRGIEVGRGVFSFFIGGLSFQLTACLCRRGIPKLAISGLAITTVVLWTILPQFTRGDTLFTAYHHSFLKSLLTIGGKDVGGYFSLIVAPWLFELVLFPITIVTLALLEAWRGRLGRRLTFLGNISYSSYLLHFPLQMVFALIFWGPNGERTFFYSPGSLLLFFVVLIILSGCSYRFFERPVQSFLRKRLLATPPGGVSLPASPTF